MHVVIGFGGNLGNVELAFGRAEHALSQHFGVAVRRRSSLYRTTPIGPEQPSFLNAAVLVEARLHPRALLGLCLDIEKTLGRDRTSEVRWGPRCIDLDLLVADRLVCRGHELELPHPRLVQRVFALVPAAEVAPRWRYPLLGRTLTDLAAEGLRADPHALESVEDVDWPVLTS